MTDAVHLHIKELKPNPWGAYLILVDDHDDWSLPVGLRPVGAEAVKAQLGLSGDSTVPALVESLLAFVKGKLVRVEITHSSEERWVQASAIIVHEGKEDALPIRLHDGALLARREGIPLTATLAALHQSGIRKSETPTTVESSGEEGLKRFTMGCLALGRLDEGLAACRRLMEIISPRNRDIWRTWMGDFYQLKGLPRRAAEEYAAGIAWEIKNGDFFYAIRIAEKMGAIRVLTDDCVTHQSPAMVEDFASDRFNNNWSSNPEAATVPAPGRPVGRARQFTYDLAAYGWPWLHLAFPNMETWVGATRVRFDVHVAPATGVQSLALEFGIEFGDVLKGKYLAPSMTLSSGWNSLSVSLRDPIWRMGEKTDVRLDAEPLECVLGVQFVLSGGGKPGTGTVAFTNIRIE